MCSHDHTPMVRSAVFPTETWRSTTTNPASPVRRFEGLGSVVTKRPTAEKRGPTRTKLEVSVRGLSSRRSPEWWQLPSYHARKKSKFWQTSGVSVMNLSTKPLRSQRLTKNTAEPASSIGNSPYLPTPAPSIQKACRERLATALKLAGSDLCKTALYTARRRPRRDRRIKNGGVRMRVTKSASYLEFYSF